VFDFGSPELCDHDAFVPLLVVVRISHRHRKRWSLRASGLVFRVDVCAFRHFHLCVLCDLAASEEKLEDQLQTKQNLAALDDPRLTLNASLPHPILRELIMSGNDFMEAKRKAFFAEIREAIKIGETPRVYQTELEALWPGVDGRFDRDMAHQAFSAENLHWGPVDVEPSPAEPEA
jgi:hypothetical protein